MLASAGHLLLAILPPRSTGSCPPGPPGPNRIRPVQVMVSPTSPTSRTKNSAGPDQNISCQTIAAPVNYIGSSSGGKKPNSACAQVDQSLAFNERIVEGGTAASNDMI